MADEIPAPTSVADARARLASAKEKKLKIEFQLAVRKHDDDPKWRQRALFSRLCAEQEIAVCRRYLADAHRPAAVPR